MLSLPAFITADIFENCTFSSIPQDGSKRDLVAESHCTKVKDTTMHHIVDSLMNVSYCSVAAVLLAYPRESIKVRNCYQIAVLLYVFVYNLCVVAVA